jgi:pyruvate dehydrogenase E1 component alpha subunit
MDPKAIMAELFGKITGCVREGWFDAHVRRGAPLSGRKRHRWRPVPIATGVAFKQMYDNDGGVTLCYFGDGAIHQGAFHEESESGQDLEPASDLHR